MKTLLTLVIFGLGVFAASAGADAFYPYAGLGLQTGSLSLSSDTSSSRYLTYGYIGEAGLNLEFNKSTVLRMSAEYIGNTGSSAAKDDNFIESSNDRSIGARVGLNVNRLGAGVGYRKSSTTLRSLAVGASSLTDATYSDMAPFFFGSFTVDIDRRYRASIQAEYISGKLKPSDSNFSDVKYNSTTLSLRFYLLFD